MTTKRRFIWNDTASQSHRNATCRLLEATRADSRDQHVQTPEAAKRDKNGLLLLSDDFSGLFAVVEDVDVSSFPASSLGKCLEWDFPAK